MGMVINGNQGKQLSPYAVNLYKMAKETALPESDGIIDKLFVSSDEDGDGSLDDYETAILDAILAKYDIRTSPSPNVERALKVRNVLTGVKDIKADDFVKIDAISILLDYGFSEKNVIDILLSTAEMFSSHFDSDRFGRFCKILPELLGALTGRSNFIVDRWPAACEYLNDCFADEAMKLLIILASTDCLSSELANQLTSDNSTPKKIKMVLSYIEKKGAPIDFDRIKVDGNKLQIERGAKLPNGATLDSGVLYWKDGYFEFHDQSMIINGITINAPFLMSPVKVYFDGEVHKDEEYLTFDAKEQKAILNLKDALGKTLKMNVGGRYTYDDFRRDFPTIEIAGVNPAFSDTYINLAYLFFKLPPGAIKNINFSAGNIGGGGFEFDKNKKTLSFQGDKFPYKHTYFYEPEDCLPDGLVSCRSAMGTENIDAVSLIYKYGRLR